MTHEELRESLPAFALGALDTDEHREVSAHAATCQECSAELKKLAGVVEGIGLEATPVSPPAGLRARVLARIANERQVPDVKPRSERPSWAGGLALAASVTLAVAAVLYAFALRSENAQLRNILSAPDMLRVDLAGQATATDATGRAFWSRTGGLMFTANRLPSLPKGRVYQLWTITGAKATGAGLFTPDAQGTATVTVAVAADAPRPDAFGVTIEPEGGSATPTMPIVMVGASK